MLNQQDSTHFMVIKKLTLILSFFSIPIFSSVSWGQIFGGPTEKMIESRFRDADKNQDGKLTLLEAKEGMPRVAKNFELIDAEGRGFVTVEQIKKAAADQAKK